MSPRQMRHPASADPLQLASWTDLFAAWRNAAATLVDASFSVSDSSRPDSSFAGMAATAGSTAEMQQHASNRQRHWLHQAEAERRSAGGDHVSGKDRASDVASEDGPLDSVLALPGHLHSRQLLRGAH